MGKSNDPIWEHVEIPDRSRDRWKCKYCQLEFAGRFRVRVRAHLGRVPRLKIAPCNSTAVPEEVRSEARAFLREKGLIDRDDAPRRPYKRQRTGSSNVQGQSQDSTSNPAPVMGEASSSLEHKMERLERNLSLITHRSTRKKEDLHQVTHMTEECLEKLKAIKTKYGKTGQGGNHDSLQLLETELDELASTVDELFTRRGILSESLEGEAFFLADPVGLKFVVHMDYVWNSFLGADVSVSRIGLCGMAGVGKTFLAKHIHNKACGDKSFENVFWVSVSKDATVRDLQIKVARAANAVSIFTILDEEERAVSLREQLMKKGKSVLILDDVWKYYDLEKVGIPIQADGMKLLITTRSLSLCSKMLCQERIVMECFGEEEEKEAVSLFLNHLRCESLHPQGKEILGDVVRSCGGLPLAIVETANIIRGVVIYQNWPSDLKYLAAVGLKEAFRRIFPILKASFDDLNIQTQQCFLMCAIRGDLMARSDLIETFLDEALISRSSSRAAMLEKGDSVIDGLIDACLLERDGQHYVLINDVIKRMAIDIMSRNCMLLVNDFENAGDENYWPTDLQLIRISSDDVCEDKEGDGDEDEDEDAFEHLLDGISPNVPELSTLLMDNNFMLTRIPSPFFQHLNMLKVLDLSRSRIKELPDSISDLLLLEVLLLRECKRLSRVPSLARLTALTKLDLLDCEALEEVPVGLEGLFNLQYLELLGTGIRQLQVEVFQMMAKLRYLSLGEIEFQLTAPLELEYLRCYFYNVDQLYNSVVNGMPSQYDLTIVEHGIDCQLCAEESYKRIIQICGDRGGEICLPGNVQKLVINSSGSWLLKFLDGVSREDSCTKMVMGEAIDVIVPDLGPYLVLPPEERYLVLTEVHLFRCGGLKCLFTASATHYLKNLQTLNVTDCVDLEGVVTAAGVQIPDGTFPSLEHIHVRGCEKMRTLLGRWLVPHLRKLCSITVENCKSMKQIIESSQPMPALGQSSEGSSSSSLPLLQLDTLHLLDLPELDLIYDGLIECKDISLRSCPKLNRVPVSLSMGPDGRFSAGRLSRIKVDSEEMWESLEWPSMEAKTLLELFSTW